jgi:UPF0271 protein
MLVCDLNCDMGEGMANEALIMPFISSANIACGFHAGNSDIIRKTMDLALKYQVKIGAHPSFRDKENFGRREMQLPADKLYAIMLEQLIKIDIIAKEKGAALHHVKPHGALYNMAARDRTVAATIATAIKDFNEDLVLYGLSGSAMIEEAQALGLKTASEVFADRSYQDDGTLTPRSEPGALIDTEEKSIAQVWLMIRQGQVLSLNGKLVPIKAETICIHGDNRQAVFFARKLYSILQQNNIASTPA